jgi:hypothetical protein
MTNREKDDLRKLAKEGRSFREIRGMVDCGDGTIRQYIKVFSPKACAEFKPKEGNNAK